MIIRAGEKLAALHLSGRIHGDIKPQNMLLSSNDIALIDSLNLHEGEIPPALSPDWAAPEQLLMRAVSKATDIYPLGLMLCALISGQLTGEYVQYVLPASNRDELIVPLVRNPIIYLSPRDEMLTLAGRKAWFDLVESCLAFDMSQRPKDADDFTAGLKSVCHKYPLEGSIEIEIKPALSPELAIFDDGSEQPCRVITDKWSSLQRPPVMD
jgi:serine/threonine protein kinase